jgi:hypothetical protein
MTKTEARERGALCTEYYYQLSLLPEKRSRGKFWMLCLKRGKYLVNGEARCGLHTPKALRTKRRAL